MNHNNFQLKLTALYTMPLLYITQRKKSIGIITLTKKIIFLYS